MLLLVPHNLFVFKITLSTRSNVSNYYCLGNRKGQVFNNIRLRTNCSNINYCLFCKNIVDNNFVLVMKKRMQTNIFFTVHNMNKSCNVGEDIKILWSDAEHILFGDLAFNGEINGFIFKDVWLMMISLTTMFRSIEVGLLPIEYTCNCTFKPKDMWKIPFLYSSYRLFFSWFTIYS